MDKTDKSQPKIEEEKSPVEVQEEGDKDAEDSKKNIGVSPESPEELRRAVSFFEMSLSKYFKFDEEVELTVDEELEELLKDYPKELKSFQQIDKTLKDIREELERHKRVGLKDLEEIEESGDLISEKIHEGIAEIDGLFAKYMENPDAFKGGLKSILDGIKEFVENVRQEILKPLIKERIASVVKEEEGEATVQMMEEEYYDDEEDDDNASTDAGSVASDDTQDNEEEDEEDEGVVTTSSQTEDTVQKEETEAGHIIKVKTKDQKILTMWEKMKNKGFIKGQVPKKPDEDGVYVFGYTNPVFPEGSDLKSKKEFIKSNVAYSKQHGGHFQEISNPLRVGEFYPEAIFLDEDALDLYLDGQYTQLRSYLVEERQDLISADRLPAEDEGMVGAAAPRIAV